MSDQDQGKAAGNVSVYIEAHRALVELIEAVDFHQSVTTPRPDLLTLPQFVSALQEARTVLKKFRCAVCKKSAQDWTREEGKPDFAHPRYIVQPGGGIVCWTCVENIHEALNQGER